MIEPRLSGAIAADTRTWPAAGGGYPAPGASGSRIGNRCRSGTAPASGLRNAAYISPWLYLLLGSGDPAAVERLDHGVVLEVLADLGDIGH